MSRQKENILAFPCPAKYGITATAAIRMGDGWDCGELVNQIQALPVPRVLVRKF